MARKHTSSLKGSKNSVTRNLAPKCPSTRSILSPCSSHNTILYLTSFSRNAMFFSSAALLSRRIGDGGGTLGLRETASVPPPPLSASALLPATLLVLGDFADFLAEPEPEPEPELPDRVRGILND